MIRNIILIAIFLLLIGGFIAWYEGNLPPHVSVPTPTPPSGPNAFDDFARAVRLEQHKAQVDMAITTHGSDAAPDLNSGLAGMSIADAGRYAADNRPAVEALRAGFDHSYFAPPIRSFSTTMPYLAEDRSLARLMRFEGRYAVSQGNWSEAVRDDIDAMEIGAQVEQHGDLIQKLVGVACRAVGRRDVWNMVDRLSGPESAAAARRMERIETARAPAESVLREEKYGSVAGLQEVLSNPAMTQDFGALMGESSEEGTTNVFSPALSTLFFTIHPKRRIMADYIRYMDDQIRIAEMPYQAGRRAKPPTANGDPIVQMLVPVFSQALFKVAEDDAFSRLLMTALALRAYKADNGAYPSSLDRLVPKYLSAVPQDPFADSGPLRYKLLGASRYLLYSLGPDDVDDGGKPFEHADGNGRNPSRTLLNQDDKGDVVAMMNPG